MSIIQRILGAVMTPPVQGPVMPDQQALEPSLPSLSVDQMPQASTVNNNAFPAQLQNFNGSKFFGGFGATKLFEMDYWELRAKSAQLFRENLYARGLIRRLVTNEINTGLCLESTPDEATLGVEEGSLNEWAEDIERRFELWGANPLVCDFARQDTWPKMQKTIRRESLIEGDILVVVRQDAKTQMPAIQLISGSSVVMPFGRDAQKINKRHRIKHGVEKDTKGRVIAYWVKQEDGSVKRLRAFARNGRRLSWLVYGTDKRKDDVRGEPLLSIILQSLKEIDRYRDSFQRKMVINSIVAMSIEKSEDKPGTLPMTGGAKRKDTATINDGDGQTRTLDLAAQIPGLVPQELQVGEKLVYHSTGNGSMEFGPFETAMIRAIAWANEVPPEILELSFSNNYSASQAAINEFKIYLNPVRADFGQSPCQYVYIEWLLSEALLRRITAPQLLETWRDPLAYEQFGAWVAADWSGAIKPSTDILKQAKGYKELVNKAWVTNGRASRELTGTKFEKNVKKVGRENTLLVEALRPLAEFRKEFPESAGMVDDALQANANGVDVTAITEQVAEALQEEQTTTNEAV